MRQWNQPGLGQGARQEGTFDSTFAMDEQRRDTPSTERLLEMLRKPAVTCDRLRHWGTEAALVQAFVPKKEGKFHRKGSFAIILTPQAQSTQPSFKS